MGFSRVPAARLKDYMTALNITRKQSLSSLIYVNKNMDRWGLKNPPAPAPRAEAGTPFPY